MLSYGYHIHNIVLTKEGFSRGKIFTPFENPKDSHYRDRTILTDFLPGSEILSIPSKIEDFNLPVVLKADLRGEMWLVADRARRVPAAG